MLETTPALLLMLLVTHLRRRQSLAKVLNVTKHFTTAFVLLLDISNLNLWNSKNLICRKRFKKA